MLSKTEMKKGFIYEVASSSFNVAVWTGELFRGPAIVDNKLKFVQEAHYDDGLPYGTCSPIKEISSEPLKHPYDGHNLLILFRTLSDVLF